MPDYTLSAKITGDSSGFEKAFSSAQKAAQNFEKVMSTAGKKVSDIGKGIEDAGKKLTAVATTIVGVGVAGVNSFDNLNSATNQFLSRTGIAEKVTLKLADGTSKLIDRSKIYGDVMKDIYDNNYGESFEDIGNAMADVMEQMQYLDSASLQNITESAFTLRDTFGYEVAESVRAANSMVTQFGIDADEAMNLIAQGAQNGLDYSDELLDTINEYSPQFKKLGLDAEDMFHVFTAGANNGAFNLDKIGDAVKELSIRVIDGSDTTIEGFEAIGLNADQMAAKFAAGGESAKKAFNETIDALKAMDDPLVQSQAGVNLFGTMWEDLGPTAVLSLNEICDGIDSTYDAMEELKSVRYDDLKNSLSALGRTVETEVLMPIGEKLLPVVQDVVDKATLMVDSFGAEGIDGLLSAIESIAPKTKPALDAIDTLRGTLNNLGIDPTMFAGAVAAAGPLLIVLGKITSVTGGVISGLGSVTGGLGKFAESMRIAGSNGTVLSGVMTKLTSPMGATIAIIAAVAAAFAYLMATNDDFRASVMNTVSEVSASLKPSLELIGSTLMELGSTLMQSIGSVLQALAPSLAQIVAIIGDVLAMLGPVVAMLVASLVPVLEQVISMATQILTVVTPFIGLLIGQMMPAIQQIIVLVGAMLGQIIPLISQLTSALMPVIQQIITAAMQIVTAVMPVIINLISQLMPFVSQIVLLVGNLVSSLVPLVSMLISELAPIISKIVTVVQKIISALLPPLIAIIESVMQAIDALMPPIMQVLDIVIGVISDIIEAVTPVVSFVGEIIGGIMDVITPIIEFIAGIIGTIVSFVTPLIDTFSSVFSSIYNTVADIMSNVGSFISGIFEKVEGAWDGLTSFVSGVFDGISGAVSELVNTVKGFVNGVISGINSAIGLINMIPGVNIGTIPYLARGTDDWQGGFAVMNEGGRGELTYLPNGAQVIPHDISVKYAKEAARANTQAPAQTILAIDYDRLAAAMTRVRLTPVMEIDGAQVSRVLSPYTDQNMSQRTRMAARGMV